MPISRIQWIAARGVPGDSGGGRAGFSPASLRRTTQRTKGDNLYRVVSRLQQPPHRMPGKDARPRLHARLRPPPPRRFPGSRARSGQDRRADRRDLPPARRAPTTSSSRASRRSGGRSSPRSPLPGPRRLRRALGDAPSLRRASPCRASRAPSRSSPPEPRTSPVAEEARRTLEYLGVSSTLVPDVGVAGVLRLLSRLEEIERADVVIAVAGMEASLFSVLGGLVGRPIIAVPTSRGYGAAFGGPRLASLRGEFLRQRGHRGQHRLRLRRRDGGVPHSFGRTAPMGSKRKRLPRHAREYIHAAAIGVDRKRKKALLGRPTTPIKVGKTTTSRSSSTPTARPRSRPARSASARRSSRRCSATRSARRSSWAWPARSSPPACARSSST